MAVEREGDVDGGDRDTGGASDLHRAIQPWSSTVNTDAQLERGKQGYYFVALTPLNPHASSL